MNKISDTILKKRVLIGEFNFEAFTNRMLNEGFITEENYPAGAAFGTSDMEKYFLIQKEFDELYKFFYGHEQNEIFFECVATNKGFDASSNAFSYALINKKVTTREKVERILEVENHKLTNEFL